MKKLLLTIIALLCSYFTEAQKTENFALSYGLQNFDFSKNSIIHHLDGEVFFLKNVKVGIYSSFHHSGMMVEENIGEKFIYGSFGPALKIKSYYMDFKFKVGYFIEKKEISFKENLIEPSSLIQGMDLTTGVLFQQKLYNFLPKVELSAGVKIGLKRKFLEFNSEEELENVSLASNVANYDYMVNIHLYRFDIAYDYYLSPMIGIEKSESLTRKNLIQFKAGISFNNKMARSNILQIGAIFACYNYNKQQICEGEKTISPCIFGLYMNFNPSGLFIHNIKF
jgi:hypothetical protein